MKNELMSYPDRHAAINKIKELEGQLHTANQQILSQRVYTPKLLQADITTLQERLDSHEAAMEEEKVIEAKMISDSAIILEEIKETMYYAGKAIEDNWIKLHPVHRRLATEFKSMVNISLRSYVPKPKTTKVTKSKTKEPV